ncbi:hypothetical protein NIES592_08030 [Fischerella major NIES-592]|uniref:Uncharacterized protein n=1 Tax=Fischerella major NIES-592 TaxID=210994 RepID=A0A1U7H1M0_9CYAN|nr:hypothetical protein [Fischerella major]OKH14815.1 hypothetical protein NIES592_08030 [Fischerella major NIES-592]
MRRQGKKIGVPFYALTKEELKQWYKDKLITTSGYLLSIKRITLPLGKNFTIPNVLSFCDEWEISKSAFYRAVNELRHKGYLDWEATQGIILKDSGKIISIPAEDKCPARGIVSHERDTDSHERDTDSHERDTDSHERDNDIYIDRARAQRNIDIYREEQSCVEEPRTRTHKQTPLAEPKNLEEEEPEEDFSTIAPNINQSLHCQPISLAKTIVPPPQVEVKTTSTFDPKLENLVSLLDKGELKDLPLEEKKQLANYLMGEQIKLYRKSGYILATSPNDINTDFLRYVAWKDLKQPSDLGWARNTVLSYERDMTKWGQLVALVEGWQTVTPEEVAATASARIAARRGGKEDLQIAIQSSIDAYKEIKNNPFRRKA